jgi:hypothetical protein
MHVQSTSDVANRYIDDATAAGLADVGVRVEFVEINDEDDADLALARNCSNG